VFLDESQRAAARAGWILTLLFIATTDLQRAISEHGFEPLIADRWWSVGLAGEIFKAHLGFD